MDNPEKPATQGTQDEDQNKKNKNKKNNITQHRYQGLAFLDLQLTSIPLVSVLKTFLFTTVYEWD